MNAQTHGTIILPSGHLVRTREDPFAIPARRGTAVVVALTLAVAAVLAVLLPSGGGAPPSSIAPPGAEPTIADPVIVDYTRSPRPGS
jgi:hypothetical protein